MTKEMTMYSDSPLAVRKDYAQTIATAGQLVPSGLRDGNNPNPGKVLLVMETGAMLGIHPIAALQGVHIIEGKATLSPALMSAVVRKAGHKLRVSTVGTIAGGDFVATATLIRQDDPDFVYTASWTMDRATRAGLANKDVWKKYGEAMCKARAISEVCREGAEDALMGVHYTPEEMDAQVTEAGDADVIAEVEPSADWPAIIAAAQSKDDLIKVREQAEEAGEYSAEVRALVLARNGEIGRAAVVPVDAEANEEIAVEVPDAPAAERDPAEPSPEEYAAAAAEAAADQPDFMRDSATDWNTTAVQA